MGNFFSFLAFKNGDFFHASDYTDHHDDLILLKNVHDSESALLHQLFYRGEFTPPTDITQVSVLSKWNLRVDENVTPDWYDEAKTRDWCETQISKMIVKDERPIVLGGCWILDGEKARIGKLIMGKIKVATNGANLDGANLSRASLYGANLYGATNVILPKGWKKLDHVIVVKDE